MKVNAQLFRDFFNDYIEVIEENKDYLSELDRKIGDGDHGVTMSIGWQAVKKALLNDSVDDCATINILAGKTFLNAVGSSVGPLYATGFLRGAKVLKEAEDINEGTLIEYWNSFCNGIKERGGAEVGDKTMIDTLEPARLALLSSYENTNNFMESFSIAVNKAEEGMKSTTGLLSQRGRSSRLGERSLGHQDPGATSAFLLLETFNKLLVK